MENKNNHLSPKPLFLILFILIEVLVVLILPFRFVSASVILLMNLWGVRYWLKMKRWLTLNKREKIQQASTVAETNLAYVSEVMPVGVIAYQPSSQKIEWLNPLALKVKDQSGLTEEELLDTFFPVHVEIMVPLVGNHKELRYQKGIIDSTAEQVFCHRS